MYCSGCKDEYRCKEMCSKFKDYLRVIGECLNGSRTDPCTNCNYKYLFNCPLYGEDHDAWEQLQLDPNEPPDWW